MEPPRRMHTDRAPEFVSAIRSYLGGGIRHDTSIPGCPQTNSIAESRVKRVIRGVRSLLLGAGLPHCWWPVAARCYAFLHNVVKGHKEDKTKWEKMHGEPFNWAVHPFRGTRLCDAEPAEERREPEVRGPDATCSVLGVRDSTWGKVARGVSVGICRRLRGKIILFSSSGFGVSRCDSSRSRTSF